MRAILSTFILCKAGINETWQGVLFAQQVGSCSVQFLQRKTKSRKTCPKHFQEDKQPPCFCLLSDQMMQTWLLTPVLHSQITMTMRCRDMDRRYQPEPHLQLFSALSGQKSHVPLRWLDNHAKNTHYVFNTECPGGYTTGIHKLLLSVTWDVAHLPHHFKVTLTVHALV